MFRFALASGVLAVVAVALAWAGSDRVFLPGTSPYRPGTSGSCDPAGCVLVQIDRVKADGDSIRVEFQITTTLDLNAVAVRVGRGPDEIAVLKSNRLTRGAWLSGSVSGRIAGLAADRFELRVTGRLVTNGEAVTSIWPLTAPDEDLRDGPSGHRLTRVKSGGSLSIEVPAARSSDGGPARSAETSRSGAEKRR